MTTPNPIVLPVGPDNLDLATTLAPPGDRQGEVVVLLADAHARTQGWAGRAAARLASDWSGAGRHVLLADGDFADAGLHEILGRENGEGLSDLVLYGASPRRVFGPVEGERFLFSPAGTVVPDAWDALSDSRWPSLLDTFRESETVLILLLPAGSPADVGPVAGADRVVRLDSSAASPTGVTASDEIRAPDAEEPAPEASTRTSEPVGPGGTGDAEDKAVPRAEGGAPDPERDQSNGKSAERARAARRGLSPWLVLGLMILLGFALLAAWLGYIEIPGLDLSQGAGRTGRLLAFLGS